MHLGVLHADGRKRGALLHPKLVLHFCCTVPFQREQVCLQLTVCEESKQSVASAGAACSSPCQTPPPRRPSKRCYVARKQSGL